MKFTGEKGKMIKRSLKIIGLSLLAASFSPAANADELEFKATAEYLTKYIWRGQNVSDRSVFQPTVSLYRDGLTGSFWGNMDLTGQNKHRMEFIELNFVLDYTASLPDMNGVNFSIGTIHYQFPNTSARPTTEVYGGLSFDLPLTPYVRWYRDVDEIDGSYYQFGIGQSIDKIYMLTDKCYCGLSAGASVGYGSSSFNRGYSLASDDKFNDVTVSLALPIVLDSWTLRPSISYSAMLSEEVRKNTAKSDNVWFGLGLTRLF